MFCPMEGEDNDCSFKSRVDKIFGSLSSKSSWSLTGEEIEKKEWRRREKQGNTEDEEEEEQEKAVLIPSSSGMFGRNKKKRNDFADEDEDEDDGGGGKGGNDDDDEWEIRGSIGLDPTLDYEAEEDEYDKLAEGRENAGERLYMSDVTDHGPYLNSHNVLPVSVHDAVKDSRANHLAAKARLEEDKAESLKHANPLSRKAADGNKLKPILKMKDNSSSSKARRRVRFDPYCKNKPEEGNSDNLSMAMPAVQTTISDYQAWVKNSPAIPDYLLNPTKYTRYTFDSTSEVDDIELLDSVKKSNADEMPLHPPKFTPRKKESGAIPMDSSSQVAEHKQEDDAKRSGFARVIAAGEIQISDDMDVEDEQGMEKADAIKTENQKPNLRYRPRPKMDDLIS